jgi:hypothetical protein
VKYLAARKLHQEATIVSGQDPWTWLAVANTYLEQNPLDLAQIPCATMPDGKHKEHCLKPLRTAELERLHAKTVEPTMEQYIEIDELPELTGTSSPMLTLKSTSTSTSTTSSNPSKTHRRTQLDSYARPTVSRRSELVTQVPRSGRSTKKSRSTGRAQTEQPELAGFSSRSET